jgi:hypothetical protein
MKYAALCAALLAALLLLPVSWPALADDTPTPTNTPTATNTATATATSTITATPDLVVTGVTSDNQGYEVWRYINAGDVAIIVVWLIGIGLTIFLILLGLRSPR